MIFLDKIELFFKSFERYECRRGVVFIYSFFILGIIFSILFKILASPETDHFLTIVNFAIVLAFPFSILLKKHEKIKTVCVLTFFLIFVYYSGLALAQSINLHYPSVSIWIVLIPCVYIMYCFFKLLHFRK